MSVGAPRPEVSPASVGAPHLTQKRPVPGSSTPQLGHLLPGLMGLLLSRNRVGMCKFPSQKVKAGPTESAQQESGALARDG
jgi:hypothetical protein